MENKCDMKSVEHEIEKLKKYGFDVTVEREMFFVYKGNGQNRTLVTLVPCDERSALNLESLREVAASCQNSNCDKPLVDIEEVKADIDDVFKCVLKGVEKAQSARRNVNNTSSSFQALKDAVSAIIDNAKYLEDYLRDTMYDVDRQKGNTQ